MWSLASPWIGEKAVEGWRGFLACLQSTKRKVLLNFPIFNWCNGFNLLVIINYQLSINEPPYPPPFRQGFQEFPIRDSPKRGTVCYSGNSGKVFNRSKNLYLLNFSVCTLKLWSDPAPPTGASGGPRDDVSLSYGIIAQTRHEKR